MASEEASSEKNVAAPAGGASEGPRPAEVQGATNPLPEVYFVEEPKADKGPVKSYTFSQTAAAATGGQAGAAQAQDLPGGAQWWYRRVSVLELRLQAEQNQVAETRKLLQHTRKQLSFETKKTEGLTLDKGKLTRKNHELQSRLTAALVEVKDLKDQCEHLEKDKGGLCRSLGKTQLRLGHALNETQFQMEKVEGIGEENDVITKRNESLKKSIDSMSDVQEALAQQVAAEREKRYKLKDAVRAKLAKVEAEQEGWKSKIGKHDELLKKKDEKVKEVQDQLRQAEVRASQLAEHAQRCETAAEERILEKEEMHRQLRELQRIHEKMRSDFHEMQEKLWKLEQRRMEEQRTWRLEHLENVDRRISKKRSLDFEEPVAVRENRQGAGDRVGYAGAGEASLP